MERGSSLVYQIFYVKPIQISLNFFKVTKHEQWFRPQSRLPGTKEFKIRVTAQGFIYSWYEQLFSFFFEAVRGNLHVKKVTAQRQWKLDGWALIELPLLCRSSRSCCLFEKAGFAFKHEHFESGASLHAKCWCFSALSNTIFILIGTNFTHISPLILIPAAITV